MPLDSQRHRPLLPRLTQRPPHELEATYGGEGNSQGRKRRRPYTSKACNFCREKKNACDGKPECSQCLRRGLKCEYRMITDALLRAIPPGTQLVDKEEALNNAKAAELLDMLKRVPDDEVLEALKLLRIGNEPAEVSSALPKYDVGLSQVALNRAILPPTQTSLEFELMMRHPVAYPTWAPVQPSKLDLEFLLLPSKIRWDGTGPTLTTGLADGRSYLSPYGHRRGERSPDASSMIGPLRPSTLYDNRLLGVDISQWTDVPITNEFSIAVLQLYLEADHPLMPLIEVDLLLDGLLGQNEFCSRILVNALFAWACQGYAVFEPEATVIGHAFYNEAKELWKNSKETQATDHVCTVAAIQYLSITAVSFGAGAEYVEFLGDLLEMSRRLGLFNVDPSQTRENDVNDSADHRRAKNQIAWVLFTCLTFFSMHLHQRLIEHPPRVPPPDSTIYVARDTRDPGMPKDHQRRIYNAVLLREHCHLFLIVHDMIQVMYGAEQTPYAKAITLAFAEETYKRLLMWADGLPLEMAQGDQCTHHAMLLHIYYHLAIIDLFRPLLRQNGAPRQRLHAFRSTEATPDAVYAASVNQLKRIVLFYRQNHPESSYCFFWHSALLYLANAMLAETKISGHGPEWRFYFRLCMTCYQTLYTGFRLAKGITLSLLSMALEKGVMDIPQARAIRKDLELRGKHHEISDLVPVFWVVDLDLAMTDPSAAQAENLVQRFQDVQLCETTGNNETVAQEPRYDQ
ncbi:c6 transcription factor [Colletotrichum incanum]|uniref:C6 transcription factor n=1 Tax=Colletotrichum incanum TaxID=1573173 RepID=A0A166QD32_COLIC|nr:c6 transcription factor [Colletotrichum incanum]